MLISDINLIFAIICIFFLLIFSFILITLVSKKIFKYYYLKRYNILITNLPYLIGSRTSNFNFDKVTFKKNGTLYRSIDLDKLGLRLPVYWLLWQLLVVFFSSITLVMLIAKLVSLLIKV